MRKPYKKLTYADRKIIEQMVVKGKDPKAIAEATGVCFQTIYRELQRGKDLKGNYKAEIAQQILFADNSSKCKQGAT